MHARQALSQFLSVQCTCGCACVGRPYDSLQFHSSGAIHLLFAKHIREVSGLYLPVLGLHTEAHCAPLFKCASVRVCVHVCICKQVSMEVKENIGSQFCVYSGFKACTAGALPS